MSDREREQDSARDGGAPRPTTILDEIRVPEGRGRLGGRRLVSNQSGGIVREVRINFCDICGAKLAENYLVCPACRRKVDPPCSVKLENQTLCTNCLRNNLPLSKRCYEVLVCIANNLRDTRVLRDLTRIDKYGVRDSLNALLAQGLVEKKGLSIFSSFHVTDQGMVALGTLRHIFGKDADISYLDAALRKHLASPGLRWK